MKLVVALLLSLIGLTAPVAASPRAVRVPYFWRVIETKSVQVPSAASGVAVVNAASYLPGVSPGGMATVFGRDLSSVNGIAIAGTNPLPLELVGVSIVVNGISAPVFSVAYANGEDQISFQVPYATPTGPGAAQVEVLNYGDTVAIVSTDSFVEDPGIFTYDANYAVAEHPFDGSLIGPGNPAFPGETIVLYTTGLGPLTLDLIDGVGAPSNPLAYTEDPFQVVVNSQQCQVTFSGLAPGFVGLYQVNLRLPPDLPAGNLPMQIFSAYSNSGIASLPVR